MRGTMQAESLARLAAAYERLVKVGEAMRAAGEGSAPYDPNTLIAQLQRIQAALVMAPGTTERIGVLWN